MKKKLLTALCAALVILAAQTSNAAQAVTQKGEVTTVPSVDLKRYAGKWYEIAKLPNEFQKDCVGNTSAEYVLQPKGSVEVTNRCLKKNGDYSNAKGTARVTDKRSNAKLEVRFAPAFLSFIPQVWGDYWIIDLEPNYRYAVVGNPDRKYLWILSRTAQMDDATYQQILRNIEKMGYDPNKLIKTPQNVETLKGTVVGQKQ